MFSYDTLTEGCARPLQRFLFLAKTHQYAFAEVECFMEVKTLFNGPKVLLNCGLEIISEIGSLLDGIVDLESEVLGGKNP